MTSLEDGAVADADGGPERASSAPVTRRKSPMEIERRVAGDAMASRAVAEVDGGKERGKRAWAAAGGNEDEEEDDDDAKGASGGGGGGDVRVGVRHAHGGERDVLHRVLVGFGAVGVSLSLPHHVHPGLVRFLVHLLDLDAARPGACFLLTAAVVVVVVVVACFSAALNHSGERVSRDAACGKRSIH